MPSLDISHVRTLKPPTRYGLLSAGKVKPFQKLPYRVGSCSNVISLPCFQGVQDIGSGAYNARQWRIP